MSDVDHIQFLLPDSDDVYFYNNIEMEGDSYIHRRLLYKHDTNLSKVYQNVMKLYGADVNNEENE